MALVNTAYGLARRGYRVLLVDFDLEAPGMTWFFQAQVEAHRRAMPDARDAVDLLLAVRDGVAHTESQLGLLDRYVVPIALPDGWSDSATRHSAYFAGRIDLIPAVLRASPDASTGRLSASYLDRLDELALGQIYGVDGPKHRFGDRVRRLLTAHRMIAPGDPLTVLRDTVTGGYDLVLIDSRTGLNEVAGLCIGPLCDSLVLCAGLNRQNIDGLRYFMEVSGLADERKAKPFVVAAGPVPPWRTREAAERLDEIYRFAGHSRVVTVPYHPRAALEETVFLLTEPSDPISMAYDSIATTVPRPLADETAQRWDSSWRELPATSQDDQAVQASRQKRDLTNGILRAIAVADVERRIGRVWPYQGAFPSQVALWAACSVRLEPNPEAVAVAAAVASMRLGSPKPFDLAWDRGEAEPYDPRYFSGASLVFYQARLFGRLPRRAAAKAAIDRLLQSRADDDEAARYHPRRGSSFVSDWVGRAMIHAVQEGSASRQRSPDETVVPLRSSVHRGLLSWLPELLTGPELDSYPSCVLDLHLPGKRELPERVWLLASAASGLPEGAMTWVLERRRSNDDWGVPLGFWPAPVLAMAISATRGADDIDKVLFWLRLSQQTYGYCWRVMVNWERFEPVQSHPMFQDFVEDEDAFVEEIEGRIDRGEILI